MLFHAAGIRVTIATANKRGFENGSETPWTSLDCVINHVESHDNTSFIVVSTNISCSLLFFSPYILVFVFFFPPIMTSYIFLMASFNFTSKKRKEYPVSGRCYYPLRMYTNQLLRVNCGPKLKLIERCHSARKKIFARFRIYPSTV